MNYRHIFHAGNICDTVKHSVLTLIIAALRGKDKAFCVLDTHAGIGLYDLADPRALKTNEAQSGIYKLRAANPLPELADYMRVLDAVNADVDLRFYPGSPVIARHMLREQDRLVLCELHDEDVQELKRQFRSDKQVQVHHRNGYEALKAFLPPQEKRGLVLMDPPFEEPDEFPKLIAALSSAHARWKQGMFVIWYPIKDRPLLWQFHEALTAVNIPETLCAEFVYEEEARVDRLNGCGFILVNPPWKLDEQLRGLFPKLHEALETGYRGVKVEWLNK